MQAGHIGLSLTAPRTGGGGSSFAPYPGLIATRSYSNNNVTSTESQYMGRTRIVLTEAASSMRVAYTNWYTSVSGFIGTDTDGTASLTIKVGVETVAGGNLGLIQWSGSSTGTITAGATLLSDVFNFGSTLAAGTTVYLRPYITRTGGGIPHKSTSQAPGMFDTTGGEVSEFGTTVTDRTASTGTWTGTTSQAAIYPAVVLGTTTKPTAVILGDSRQEGVGDTPNANGDAGEAARIWGAAGYGYLNMGIGSNSAKTWVSKSPYQRYLLSLANPSHVFVAYGANDIRSGNGAGLSAGLGLTSAETTAWTKNIWDAVGTGRPITQLTMDPLASTTDSWATVVNQTADNNQTELLAFNAANRLLPTPIQAVIDPITVTGNAPTTTVKWQVDGTANKYTGDGLHPSAFAYGLVQALTPTATTIGALRSTYWTPFALMPLSSAGLPYGVWVDQLEYVSRPSGLTSGNSVSTWSSRSSGGAFSQTLTNRPTVSTGGLNSRDAFNFASASTQYMVGSGASTLQGMLSGQNGCLMWAVIQPQSHASFGTILESRNGASSIRAAIIVNVTPLRFATVSRRSDADASVTVNGSTTLTTGSNYIVIAYFDASTNTTTLYLNGVQDGTGAVGTGSGTFQATSGVATLGGSSSGTALFNGLIAEAGCAPTSGTFSAGNITSLYNYLKAKYGL